MYYFVKNIGGQFFYHYDQVQLFHQNKYERFPLVVADKSLFIFLHFIFITCLQTILSSFFCCRTLVVGVFFWGRVKRLYLLFMKSNISIKPCHVVSLCRIQNKRQWRNISLWNSFINCFFVVPAVVVKNKFSLKIYQIACNLFIKQFFSPKLPRTS